MYLYECIFIIIIIILNKDSTMNLNFVSNNLFVVVLCLFYETRLTTYSTYDRCLGTYFGRKSRNTCTTNPINMGGNRITSLADPTEDTGGIYRVFLIKSLIQ